ncbi:MAG TPA: sialate O-acetylesterase [Rariglobus sp.]|nr:sialate O-acetylesterase [Rariglobus sp.]
MSGPIWDLQAEVRMPLIFGDHMVLQQGATIPVWGWASPGEKVTVSFSGQVATATGGADGKWRVDLQPVAVDSNGQVLSVSGTNKVTFQDVLVGDVWVASGQSNMEWGINGKKQYVADVDKATDSLLRLFFVPKTTSLTPLDDILPWPFSYSGETMETAAATPPDDYRARWVLCTPDALRKINRQGFATAAYFFARDIRQSRGQPLGMIQSSWGGTRAEAWTSVTGLKKEPVLAHYVQREEKAVADFPELQKTYPRRKADYEAALAKWNVEVGKPWDKAKDVWRKEAAADKAAGRQPAPEPMPASPRPSTIHPPDNDTNTPGNLFNAMISPLIPFAIKGVIWYQGEFNSGGYNGGHEYATLFPRMITDWREHWGRGNFPFVFVQLPNFGAVVNTPSQSPGSWVWIRDAQLKTLALPNTGMAITIDIGEPEVLHPPDKLDVGHRLARVARHVAYGENIVATGPIYQSMKVEGREVRLSFNNCGSGLTLGVSPYNPTGKPLPVPTELKGFGIAGADKKFVWAKAVIEGNTVVVSSDQVPAPVAVRYDWAESPEGNLYNKEGLPASPFRSDDWRP